LASIEIVLVYSIYECDIIKVMTSPYSFYSSPEEIISHERR